MTKSELTEKLIDIISEYLSIEKERIHLKSNFYDDFGADSLDLIELLMGVEEKFETNIPDKIAENITTVKDFVDYIAIWLHCKPEFPRIGDIVTTEKAIELCEYFKLDYIIERIKKNPKKYKDWRFDGCSCVPDQILGLLTGCDRNIITFLCCLPHDLGYAYGEPGNKKEKEEVDNTFHQNLLDKAGMKPWIAKTFLTAVEVGGAEEFGLSFSWAFAHKGKK